MARKKKKEYLSQEEIKEQALQRSLSNIRNYAVINEPTLRFEIGERITYGAIDKTVIIDILDNGKILKIHTTHTIPKGQQNAGTVIENDSFIVWHDVVKYRSKNNTAKINSFIEQKDVHISFFNSTLDSIFSKYYYFGIDMNPDYQRGNVWALEDKQKLIDSVFKNLDIGKFVFIKLPITNEKLFPMYEVLDGKQRIQALVDFKERRFKYKGKTYDDLCFRDRHHFKGYPIAVGEISENITAEQRYRYFLRLNTTGHLQDPKHLQFVERLLKKA